MGRISESLSSSTNLLPHTALKLNNMTHETFAVEDVISDSLFRANPIVIAGYKFKFVKLSPSLVGFGAEIRQWHPLL